MSSDVIIGHDGKPRCSWAGDGNTDIGRYHDEVWGTRTHDESARKTTHEQDLRPPERKNPRHPFD